ncbi:MAG: cytochrome c oxidase subunit 1 [Myxococcota bacterium]|jgi:cytochrome c oxidase subunit 1
MSAVSTQVETHNHAADQSTAQWLWSILTSVDHKTIGRLYLLSGILFFVVGGVEALAIRLQLSVPNADFVSAQRYNELFTMHATTMIFLSVMPMAAGFTNFFLPLQIGARDVVFPRLNAYSYWLWLAGALFINSSFLVGAFPDGGWFGYANMSGTQYSPGPAMDFWNIGLMILGVSSMTAGFNFITTVLNLRAPGMSLFRMPVLTWMFTVVQFLVVMSFPILTIAQALLLFDRNYGTNFYVPAKGGDPLLWQHLFWLFGHPEVYILILPSMGIVSEVLPTFSRKPLFGAPFVIFSGILIGFLGFGVWSHHMFTTGLGPVADSAFSLTTMLIAIPTAVKIFNWIATMWGGKLRFTAAMYHSIGFVFLFTIGGLSGVMHASPPIDLQHQDSYFVVAHFHYVLFGGSVIGLFSGIYFYWPKMFGRMLSERLGKIGFWLFFVGMNLTFFPMHFLGVQGMPRRIFRYEDGLGWETANALASIGALIIAAGMAVHLYAMISSFMRPKDAPSDPWDAATLEWSIASPPHHYNFAVIPEVHSDRPFWDEKHENGPVVSQEKLAGPGEHHVPMPPASYWPIIAAFFTAGTFICFMLGKGADGFDPAAFQRQVMFQGVFATLMLLSILAWIREDATHR